MSFRFFPLIQQIEVTSEKILNVIFSQLKTKISGKVQCINRDDCEGLAVVLKSGEANEVTLKVTGKYWFIINLNLHL